MTKYYRVESYGGDIVELKDMHSQLGIDQIDFECEMCGNKKAELLELCDECGESASQANKYAQLVKDLKIKKNKEDLYILPGIFAFDNINDAEEYAGRVSEGVLCEYIGTEIYSGTQEPDYGADEFLIRPKKRVVCKMYNEEWDGEFF